MPPENYDCPQICPLGLSPCSDCPVKSERAEFEESLKESLQTAVGDQWKKYGLKSLISTVIDVSEIEDSDKSKWTITTDHLVNILKNERRRIERIERFNNRTENKS